MAAEKLSASQSAAAGGTARRISWATTNPFTSMKVVFSNTIMLMLSVMVFFRLVLFCCLLLEGGPGV